MGGGISQYVISYINGVDKVLLPGTYNHIGYTFHGCEEDTRAQLSIIVLQIVFILVLVILFGSLSNCTPVERYYTKVGVECVLKTVAQRDEIV